MIIKEALEDQGRKQVWLKSKLAEKNLKLSTAQISQIVRGKAMPRDSEVLMEICRLLDIEVEEVLKEFEANKKN